MKVRFLRLMLLVVGLCLGCGEITQAAPEIPSDGKVPLRFVAYEGSSDHIGDMSFLVQVSDKKAGRGFVKIGDQVPGTDFKVVAFVYVVEPRNGGEPVDRSKLKLYDVKTEATVLLTIGETVRLGSEHLIDPGKP